MNLFYREYKAGCREQDGRKITRHEMIFILFTFALSQKFEAFEKHERWIERVNLLLKDAVHFYFFIFKPWTQQAIFVCFSRSHLSYVDGILHKIQREKFPLKALVLAFWDLGLFCQVLHGRVITRCNSTLFSRLFVIFLHCLILPVTVSQHNRTYDFSGTVLGLYLAFFFLFFFST